MFGVFEPISDYKRFPNQASLDRVVADYDLATRKSWTYLLVLPCLVVAAIPAGAAIWVIDLIFPPAPMPPGGGWRSRITSLIGLAVVSLIAAAIHQSFFRRRERRFVRRRLIEIGLPTCVPCGYDLSGLPPIQVACPECGRPLAEDVRVLIANGVRHT